MVPAEQELPTLAELPFGGDFPERSAQFLHGLHEDARLSPEAVADLADRLPGRSVIYDTAAHPLLVPDGGPPRGTLARPGDVIRQLEDANAWLTLLNIEDDPDYADLVNQTCDALEPGTLGRHGPMRRQMGSVFISSPNSVTPAHFDIEHSLLMQVSGSKTVTTGRFESDQVRRHELDRYWDGSHGRIESLPPEVASYSLTPGRGVYIPPATPHWVQNGPAVTLSVTLSYVTTETEREHMIEAVNARLRRLHLSPRRPHQSGAVDAAKVAAMRARDFVRHLRSRTR
jgi:hypothetical protein